MLVQDYVLRDPQTSAVAAYGPFQLEREDCVERPGVGVLHYARCVPKARLTWSSADGQVTARYEDNGELLTRTYQFMLRANAPEKCYIGGAYSAYRTRLATTADWEGGKKAFGTTLARCSAFGPAQIATYQAQFTAAAPLYERASGGLRSLAFAMFRNLRRCTEQKTSPRHGGFDATLICARREGPASRAGG